MTRIDIVEEEESFSDSTTASCNTTDEVQSAIENDSSDIIESALRRFQEEQLENEAAQDYYSYCRYYYRHIDLAEEDDDDEVNGVADREEKGDTEKVFRQNLATTVLSYILAFTKQLNCARSNDQGPMTNDLELRPKFSILKHTPETLDSSKTSNAGSTGRTKQTPEWYFNIPDTLTPFPDFGAKNMDQNN